MSSKVDPQGELLPTGANRPWHSPPPEKVTIQFQLHSGFAPMKSESISVGSHYPWARLVAYCRTQLQTDESLFLFVNQSFTPALDDTIGDIWRLFAQVYDPNEPPRLLVRYSAEVAWG